MYYLQRSSTNRRFVSGELWMADLETDKKQRLLPDFLMEHYNVSPDGKQVVFITADGTGHAPISIATLDGSSAPRNLVDQDCVRARFAPDGEIYFVGGAGRKHVPPADQSGRHGPPQKIISDNAAFLYDISPDGKWVAAWVGSDVNRRFFRRGAGHSGMFRLCFRWRGGPWSDTALDHVVP